jgi:exopolysaccharide biosynthesis predicted pyruvyltransferase EpsI
LVPPAGLANIGDHGQVVAIQRWLAKHFVGVPVLEIDKNEALYCIKDLRRVIGAGDLIVLHSGGNLGDRGIWSETARRKIICNFPDVPIVSLPQTIYFSDTPEGRRQQSISQEIYNAHPNLTVMGRDRASGHLARSLFSSATTLTAPDFVLSLDYDATAQREIPNDIRSSRVLLCLRRDNESVFTDEDKTRLQQSIPGYTADRYHGLIFAVLCRRPAVVLRTVDHKLTSAFDWFEGIDGVRFAQSVVDVPESLTQVLAIPFGHVIDWNREFFDPLAEHVKSTMFAQWTAG